MNTAVVEPGAGVPSVRPGPRIRIGTLLLMTAALAPLIAFFVRLDGRSGDPIVLVATLALVLCGVGVGAARRVSVAGIVAQVGLAGLIVVAAFEMYDGPSQPFTLLGIVALTVVTPLLVRNGLDRIAEARRRQAAAVAAILWNTGLTLGAWLAYLYIQNEFFRSSSPRTVAVPAPAPIAPIGPPITIYAPGPGNVSPSPAVPVPTRSSPDLDVPH
jgi:hypothetical protein